MEISWYVARKKKVFGPFTEAQLQKFATEGRFDANELVQKSGATDWKLAHEAFDWMLPPDDVLPEVGPEQIAAVHKVLVTCMACYSETETKAEAHAYTIRCPQCDSELRVEAVIKDNSHHMQFDGIGGDLTERIQQKMHDAYAAEAAENLAFRQILGGIVRNI